MKLVPILATATAITVGSVAFTMGDPLMGILIMLCPLVGWLIAIALHVRNGNQKADTEFAARLKQHEEEYEKMKEAHRVRAQAEYERATRNRIPTPSAAQQQQAHIDRQRALYEQHLQQRQQSVYNGYGFLDPRSTYGQQQSQNNVLSDTVNALALYSLMSDSQSRNQPEPQRWTPVASEPAPQVTSTSWSSGSSDTSSSSSSSYSSDTSSDSFGGSDTSSDSF